MAYTDRSSLARFDSLVEEQDSATPELRNSQFETPQMSRQPMNQLEFDERYAYYKPEEHNNCQSLGKKILKRYYHPFSSGRSFLLCLQSIFPIIHWLPNYSIRKNLFHDIVGGLTVGIMHVPQGIAYASLANVDPVVGLYTSLFPVLTYMFFGTSRQCSLGSFAVVALMAGQAVDRITSENAQLHKNSTDVFTEYTNVEVASALCLLIGMIQFAIGFLGLGFITAYFSDEVVAGFTTGASFHVFTLQLKDVFGFRGLEKHMGFGHLFKRYKEMIFNYSNVNLCTILVSSLTIVFLTIGKQKINPIFQRKLRSPVPIPFELIAVVFGTLFSSLLRLHEKYEVDVVGHIPTGFPAPSIPHFELLSRLLPDAISISVVILAVHISLAKMLAKRFSYEVDTNQEFYALGASSCISSFFPVFPISCSLARTMVNAGAGTKSQLSSLFSCMLLATIIMFSGSWLEKLPMSVLACIIVVALQTMLDKFKYLKVLWPLSKIEFMIWVVSFLSTVVYDVMEGLTISIVFALFTTVVREQWPGWHVLANIPGTEDFRDAERYKETKFMSGIYLFRFDSPLLFTNVDNFKTTIATLIKRWDVVRENTTVIAMSDEKTKSDQASLRHLIVDCSGFTFIDMMGINSLKEVYEDLARKDVVVFFAAAKASLRELFEANGMYEYVPKTNFYPTIMDAVQFAKQFQIAQGMEHHEHHDGFTNKGFTMDVSENV